MLYFVSVLDYLSRATCSLLRWSPDRRGCDRAEKQYTRIWRKLGLMCVFTGLHCHNCPYVCAPHVLKNRIRPDDGLVCAQREQWEFTDHKTKAKKTHDASFMSKYELMPFYR